MLTVIAESVNLQVMLPQKVFDKILHVDLLMKVVLHGHFSISFYINSGPHPSRLYP